MLGQEAITFYGGFIIKYLLALAVVFCTSLSTFADGCYFPEKAIPSMPEITTQKAVISFDGQEETLVISSELDSKSQELGWIIPLPSSPTVMEKISPWMVNNLSQEIQPEVHHTNISTVKTLFGFIAFAILISFCVCYKKDDEIALCTIATLFVASLFSSMFATMGASAGEGKGTTGVKEVQQCNVGNYQVSIIKADESESLNEWLTEHALATIPEQGKSIVEDYIKANWVFAAIKLKRDKTGKNAPHPIKFTFPTSEAIYPMKLTALANSDMYLELFVIGKQEAHVEGLETQFCDTFKPTTLHSWISQEQINGVESNTFQGIELSADELCQMMTKNNCLTKLVGTIAPSEMDKDMLLSWSPYSSYRKVIYSYYWVSGVALVIFIGTLFCIALTLKIRKPRENTEHQPKHHVSILIAFTLIVVTLVLGPVIGSVLGSSFTIISLTIVVCGVIYVVAKGIYYIFWVKGNTSFNGHKNDKISFVGAFCCSLLFFIFWPKESVEIGEHWIFQHRNLTQLYQHLLIQDLENKSFKSLSEARHAVKELINSETNLKFNPFTNKPIVHDESPGNFTVEISKEGHALITIYGRYCEPIKCYDTEQLSPVKPEVLETEK